MRPKLVESFLKRQKKDVYLRLCCVIALVFVLMPAEGVSWLDWCWCSRFTGAPCPGCGLTRSCANVVRGHFVRAFNYHPFGLVMGPAALCLALLTLAPTARRDAFHEAIQDARAQGFLWVAGILFLAFGAWRWLAVWSGWQQFPSHWL